MVVGKLEEVRSCVTRNLWAVWRSVVSGAGGIDTVSPEKNWQQQKQQQGQSPEGDQATAERRKWSQQK